MAEFVIDENGEVVPEGEVVKEGQLRALADLIAGNVRADFEEIHLSGNLMDTIEVGKDFGYYMVRIPAVRYDLAKYRETRAIVYTPEKGSYADAVDASGGFSGMHKGYVELSVMRAIYQWLADCRFNATITTKKASAPAEREREAIDRKSYRRRFSKALREYLGDEDYEGYERAFDAGQRQQRDFLDYLLRKGKDYFAFKDRFDNPRPRKTEAQKDMERIWKRYHGKRKD